MQPRVDAGERLHPPLPLLPLSNPSLPLLSRPMIDLMLRGPPSDAAGRPHPPLPLLPPVNPSLIRCCAGRHSTLLGSRIRTYLYFCPNNPSPPPLPPELPLLYTGLNQSQQRSVARDGGGHPN
uniref:Predicted protein n=1 Tax=Hordeum vulgare subsp. vulgare TaxID=112509 RepID=F2E2G6_HORVV|nr:predicted protein [Hordeum vulgare subsp. vulgare]